MTKLALPLFVTLILSALFSGVASAKLDQVIIYGKDFSFSVKEPNGWTCLCNNEKEVQNLGANAVFIRKGETVGNAKALIRIRVNNKIDEDGQKDLQVDMDDYKKEYPKVVFKDFESAHNTFKIFPKLFQSKDIFSEYVVYITTGPKFKKNFSASMNVQKREATNEELKAFNSIVKSINIFGK